MLCVVYAVVFYLCGATKYMLYYHKFKENMTECSLDMVKSFIIGSKQLKGKQANTRREIKLYREFWFLDFGFALPQQLKHG